MISSQPRVQGWEPLFQLLNSSSVQSRQSAPLRKETRLTREEQATLFPFREGRLRMKPHHGGSCHRPGIPNLASRQGHPSLVFQAKRDSPTSDRAAQTGNGCVLRDSKVGIDPHSHPPTPLVLPDLRRQTSEPPLPWEMPRDTELGQGGGEAAVLCR